MRCCYLHIGTHKTGTSSIQLALAQHPDLLADAGYQFPQTGRLDSASGQHRLALPGPTTELQALLSSLIDEIHGRPYNVILSSEEFSLMLWRRPEEFQYLVDRLSNVVNKIVVILYLRRQTDFIESNYQERLKSRICLDFTAYTKARLKLDLAEFPLDYSRLLGRLEGINGIEKIVRSYDATCRPSVLTDFLQLIGWPKQIPLDEERINTSEQLVEQLKNFYRAQRQSEATEAEERLIELIAQNLPDRPRMSATIRSEIVSHFAASNADLVSRHGLTGLEESPDAERDYGSWCGLNQEPSPDHDDTPSATLDHLFSRDFVSIVTPVAKRMEAMQAALDAARSRADQGGQTIDELRRRLLAHEARMARFKWRRLLGAIRRRVGALITARS